MKQSHIFKGFFGEINFPQHIFPYRATSFFTLHIFVVILEVELALGRQEITFLALLNLSQVPGAGATNNLRIRVQKSDPVRIQNLLEDFFLN